MVYNNISTNILRDEQKELNYVVTPNAVEIYKRIVGSLGKSNKSFTLIGNYGTGKSTFLWALEKNLLKEKIFFSIDTGSDIHSYDFIKVIGDYSSLTSRLLEVLNLNFGGSAEIISELEKRRISAKENNKGLVLLMDEFGKFLEFANKNNEISDLYLLQLISEWCNDDQKDVFFVISLHQSFISYSNSLEITQKQEWEKIKGRFVELLFNEPVEQLLFFASKKLDHFKLPKKYQNDFNLLNKQIQKNNLISFIKFEISDLSTALYPLDCLSASILVNSLQRYGQNERSLFTFLNDDTQFSINSYDGKFYSVSNVFDYLVNTLGSEIYGFNNSHRSQWQTCFAALDRAELIKGIEYPLLSVIIKTVCLVNIFTKAGSLFNSNFLSNYIKYTTDYSLADVEKAIIKLEKQGIIRFYKHSNKINFLDGTDLDIEHELATASKEINHDFSVTNAISDFINFPVILVKENSYEKGTPRFFEFKILSDISKISNAEGALDGYINLILDGSLKEEDVRKASQNAGSNLFVIYKNSKEIHSEIFTINKLEYLIEKHNEDRNAVKLLRKEKEFHTKQLEKFVLNNLFVTNEQNIWYYNGDVKNIYSKKTLNETLSTICNIEFNETPAFKNELVNKEFLSPQILTARKALIRALLSNETIEYLGFPSDKFPPEKSIYISLLKDTGIHSKNKELNHFSYGAPTDRTFSALWEECTNFLQSAHSSRRNLGQLYEILSKAPFKVKKGFADFWIPLFLIINREDFALFHDTNGFVPYLTEDVLDLIHKSPSNYSVKSYEISGLNVNLLESYKELIHVSNDSAGVKSTFLSIFGNFLRFYRGLNEYTLNTRTISPKAVSFREAIKNAKDPEDALFTQFPSALGFHSVGINDDEILKSFTFHIQDSIRELRTAYDNLLNRIENTIIKSFSCNSSDFLIYKNEIREYLNNINTHLLGSEQAIVFKRMTSALDDRSSWIKSVADAALGKSIESMIDEEEALLVNNLKEYIGGLIKASELHEFGLRDNKQMVSIQVIGVSGAVLDDKIIISNQPNPQFEIIKTQVLQSLTTLDINNRKQVLMELLSGELHQNLAI